MTVTSFLCVNWEAVGWVNEAATFIQIDIYSETKSAALSHYLSPK